MPESVDGIIAEHLIGRPVVAVKAEGAFITLVFEGGYEMSFPASICDLEQRGA